MNLSSIDLNLLVVVDAVLEEGSATKAARRLSLTQSAVSNALRRARATFGDPLVVKSGRGLEPTPRALALRPKLRAILEDVREVVDPSATFDPLTTTRRFTIASTDAAGLVVLPALSGLFARELPHAQLRSVSLDYVMAAGGLARASDVDVLIGAPPTVEPGCFDEVLFVDPLVVVAASDHPDIGARLSVDRFAALPHAELALFGEPLDEVDRALAERGKQRRVHVMVPHLASLPVLVASGRYVATVSRSLARRVAGPLGLRILKPPVPLAPIAVRMLWHRRTDQDPGSQLLRALVRKVTPRPRAAR